MADSKTINDAEDGKNRGNNYVYGRGSNQKIERLEI